MSAYTESWFMFIYMWNVHFYMNICSFFHRKSTTRSVGYKKFKSLLKKRSFLDSHAVIQLHSPHRRAVQIEKDVLIYDDYYRDQRCEKFLALIFINTWFDYHNIAVRRSQSCDRISQNNKIIQTSVWWPSEQIFLIFFASSLKINSFYLHLKMLKLT